MIVRGSKSVKKQPRSDFLSAAQRRELAISLKDRLTKSYGLGFSEFVCTQVDTFLAAQGPINSQTLSELESVVCRGVAALRGGKAPQVAIPDPEVCSPVLTPSAVSEPRKAPGVEHADEEVDETVCYQQKIAQYEAEIECKKRRLAQAAVRAQLNQQILAKEESRAKQEAGKASYTACLDQQRQEQAEYAAKAAQRNAEEKARLLEMQKKIISERREAQAAQRAAEQAADEKVTASIREELSRARIEAAQKAAQKRADAAELMRKNEEWKEQRQQQEKAAREQEIQMQRIATEFRQAQEERQAAEVRARSERISSLIKAGEGTLRNVQSRKEEEEQRVRKYQAKQEALLARRDKMLAKQKKESQSLYRQFLSAQVAEKEDQARAKEAQNRQQADFWSKDKEFAAEIHRQQAEKNRKDALEYQETLNAQIEEKKVKSLPLHEAQLDRKELLRERLENLKVTKDLIELQLQLIN